VSGSAPAELSARTYWIAIAAGVALYAGWIGGDLDEPWIGEHDWNGAAWSTAARHLIERPLSETRMGVSLDHGSASLDPTKFYVHHPPLVVWLLGGTYMLFGVSETVGRLVPAAFTVFGALCLTGLATSLGGRRAGLFSLVAFLGMPSQLYYGRMPNHEPIALPLMIAATWASSAWTRRRTPLTFVGCLVATGFACLSSWPAFFFAAASGLVALRQPNGKGLFVGTAAVSTAALVFLFWQMQFVRSDGWTDLRDAFFLRSGGAEFGLGDWLSTMANWLARLLTPIGAAAVLLHVGRIIRLAPDAERAVLPLAVAGWANVLLFRQGAFVHEYYVYYLGAPAALIVGWTLARDAANAAAPLALGATLLAGSLVAGDLHRKQSGLYASNVVESPRFIVELGRRIADAFPADAKLLVDVAPIGEHLAFYADRRMIYLRQATEADLPKLVNDVDGIVANTRLSATREILDRVMAHAGDRVVERREFAVEGHTFLAVRLRRM
jgi:hypothetical protein